MTSDTPPDTSATKLDIRLIAMLTVSLWMAIGVSGYGAYRCLPHGVKHDISYRLHMARAKARMLFPPHARAHHRPEHRDFRNPAQEHLAMA